MKQNIRNIIFDLGGVVLNLDYHRCLGSFEKLGFHGIDQYLSKFHPSGIFKSLEIGQLNEDEFVSELNAAFGLQVDKKEILEAWGSFLLDIPEKRLKLLTQLKENFNVYLLSNTSQPHATIFEKKFRLNNGFQTIDDFFDDVYYSFRIGSPKPQREAYTAVLNQSGLEASESLFIDDSEINTKAANELGINSIFVDDVFHINCIDFENIEKNRNFAPGIKQLI